MVEYKYEISHYSSDEIQIFSRSNTLYLIATNGVQYIKLPCVFLDIFNFSRILRRFLRLDKCNVFVVSVRPIVLVIIRQSVVYYYSEVLGLKRTLRLKNCRNILHVDLCRLEDGTLAFGEYGANNSRLSVPIYKSTDQGLSWKVCYEFPPKSIKHIHNLKYDKFTNTIWCCTGDKDGENKIVVFNRDFTVSYVIGDGSQFYRTCDLFFKEDYVVWLMDSPGITSRVVIFNRSTKNISIGQELEGPVWYTQSINEKYFLAATSVEPGYSMEHGMAHLMFSTDLVNWEIIKSFKKDLYPINFFKYGVLAFPQGRVNIDSVYLFGEALEEFDGKIGKLNLSKYV